MIHLYTVTDTPGHSFADRMGATPGIVPQQHDRFVFANNNMMVRVRPSPDHAQATLIVAFARHSVGETLIELGLLVDALRRHQDGPIHCALPYLHYSRGNRLDEPGVSLGARVYVNFLDALGVDRYWLFDLHASDLLGFFRTPVRQASALPLIGDDLQRRAPQIDYVVAPDCGRYEACHSLAKRLGAPVDFFSKSRSDHSGHSSLVPQRRDVLKDRRLLLFDDEIVTGDTLVNAASEAASSGASEIHVAVLYSFANAATLARLNDIPQVRSFVTTNLGFPLDEAARADLQFDYQVLDCSGLLFPARGAG